jgi:hypothetical protein
MIKGSGAGSGLYGTSYLRIRSREAQKPSHPGPQHGYDYGFRKSLAHLQYSSDKYIDVLDALVERLQPRHHHGGEYHGEALPAGEGGQGTEGAPRHVARQPVVTRPLYIQRH